MYYLRTNRRKSSKKGAQCIRNLFEYLIHTKHRPKYMGQTVKDRHTMQAVPVKQFGNSYLGIKQTKSMSVTQIELSCRIGFP